MITCCAAVLYQCNRPLVIETITIGEPRGSEILVRMAASGVCHSDLSAVRGVYGEIGPCVLGHEGSGIVEAVGPDVRAVAPGDHVILNWKPACGECRPCRKGRTNLCEGNAWVDSGKMKDGTSRYSVCGQELLHFAGISTFAEYTVTDESCAVVIPRSLPLEAMSLVGCAVTTGAGAALNAARIAAGDQVAVIGCGGVGLSAIMGAKIRDAGKIIAIDRNPEALELARALGATHTLLAGGDLTDEIMALTGGGVDVAIEAVGRRESMELAAGILARGAEAILIGVAPGDMKIEVTPFLLVRREHVLRGSFYGSAAPNTTFLDLAGHYQQGRLPIDRMIKRRSLDELNAAFDELAAGALGRNVVVF